MNPENIEEMEAQAKPKKSSFKFKNWDTHLFEFLQAAGLDQAAEGFKLDMLVMSHDKEKRLLAAMERFCSTALGKPPTEDDSPEPTLDQTKQRYLPPNVPTPSQNTKAISRFLSDVRSRVDQSNRDEFIRRKPCSGPGPGTGSARTDAVKLDRAIHMKYDVVKNESGPLSNTIKPKPSQLRSSNPFSERFENVETHLGIKYVPAPPADFMLRVKHIEDHIVRLEKEYPPWAALHFNQPSTRGSVVVVPTHLTLSTRPETISEGKGKSRAGTRQESSLLRAALDKLEVQKALGGHS